MPPNPHDPRIDPALVDSLLREEVDLLARLMVMANASECRLDTAALDAALFGDDPDSVSTPG